MGEEVIVLTKEQFSKEQGISLEDGGLFLEVVMQQGWKCVRVADDGVQEQYETILQQVEDSLTGNTIEFTVMDLGVVWCFKLGG